MTLDNSHPNHPAFEQALIENIFGQERMPMGVLLLDRDLRIRRFNPTWAEYVRRYDLASGRPLVSGERYPDLFPNTWPQLAPVFEEALAGKTVRREALRLESQGTLSHWDSLTLPLGENEHVAGLAHICIDVTQRVKAVQETRLALEALSEREERLNLVLRGTNDGIWDWNIETGEVYFSPRWKSMLGYRDDEIENRFDTWHNLIHPDDLARADATLQKHLQGQGSLFKLEHRLRHKDGSYRWIQARGISLRDASGKPYRMAGSHTDITARKLAEDALRDSEANLRSLLENAHNFVVYQVAVDRSHPYGGQVVLVSPSIREIIGLDDPYRFENWFEPVHPDDLPRIREANQRAWQEGRPYDEIVRTYHPVKQRYAWLHTISTPVFDTAGNLTHFIGMVVDITAQMQAEQALQDQLAFENIVTTISTNFINLEPQEIDAGIHRALQIIGEFAGVDRSYVFRFSDNGQRMDNTHEWCAPGIAPQRHRMQNQPLEALPWFTRQIMDRRVVHVPQIVLLPHEAALDRKECQAKSIQSLLLVPMALQDRIIGFVGFDSVRSVKEWSKDNITLLKIVGEIFVNALERKRVQQALQESQLLLDQRVQERTRQLTSLLDLSYKLAETFELEPQLELILDQLISVVEYTGASIFKLDGDILRVVGYRGPIPHQQAMQVTFSLDEAGANRAVIEKREPVIISDTLGDMPMAREFQKTAGEELHTKYAYIRSWMGVPLVVRDQVIGMLCLDNPTPNYYQPTPHSKLALAFANQVAAAIENARLYAAVRQKADETQTLFAVQQAITSRLDPDTVLQMIADEARRLTNTSQGAVYLVDGDELKVAVISGDIQPEMLGYRLPVEGSVAGLALKSGKPFLVTDAEQDQRVYADIIQRVGAKSFVIVPLMTSVGPLGTITVADKQAGQLTPEDERVLTMMASGAVIALENARYYQEEQERRREADRRRVVAEGLRDILAVLNSNRPLAEVLDYITHQACQMLEASTTLIRRGEVQKGTITTEASCSLPPELDLYRQNKLYFTESDLQLMSHKPVVVPDLRTRYLKRLNEKPTRLDETQRAIMQATIKYYHSYLAVPLFIKDEIYGSLDFYYEAPRRFSEEDIRLAMSLGDQAALAIENARLRARVEQSAVAAERSRLARDLHDAVTQTLFSASLIAEVLPRLWERNHEEALRRLEELRQLTRGALAEMRSLLLELRPSALVEAELGELFRHLVDAFISRARVPVEFSIEGDADLPADVKVALYRIAQEALNNIARHANATQAALTIHCDPGEVTLVVRDDGRGFDPAKIPPEHLGLGIMNERAGHIGAILDITSEIGQGTQISVTWKEGENNT